MNRKGLQHALPSTLYACSAFAASVHSMHGNMLSSFAKLDHVPKLKLLARLRKTGLQHGLPSIIHACSTFAAEQVAVTPHFVYGQRDLDAAELIGV